jgi:uncharacterized protein (DUF433 family)
MGLLKDTTGKSSPLFRKGGLLQGSPPFATDCVIRYTVSMVRFERITIDPEVMGGKPCIRGMRVTVGMIVEALAAGRTIQDLLADFPYLVENDIREALSFVAS